jgi:hypothetical protein
MKDIPDGTPMWRFEGLGIDIERVGDSLSLKLGASDGDEASLSEWGKAGRLISLFREGGYSLELEVASRVLPLHPASWPAVRDEVVAEGNLYSACGALGDATGFEDEKLTAVDVWAQEHSLLVLADRMATAMLSIPPLKGVPGGHLTLATRTHDAVWIGERLVGRCTLHAGPAEVIESQATTVEMSVHTRSPWIIEAAEHYAVPLRDHMASLARLAEAEGWALVSRRGEQELPARPGSTGGAT